MLADLETNRKAAGLSIQKLAKMARVSNSTLLGFENADKFKELTANCDKNPKKFRTISRSIARVAAVVKLPLRPLIKVLEETTGIRASEDFLQEIELEANLLYENAEGTNQKDVYDWFTSHKPNTSIQLQIGILREGDWSSHRVKFYEEFAKLIFSKLGCKQESVNLPTLKDMCARLHEGAMDTRIHAIVGVSETVARRRLGIDFIPIPGLRFRLAALTRTPQWCNRKSEFEWQDLIWRRQKGRATMRVIAIRDEIGASYLIQECGYTTHKSMASDCQLEFVDVQTDQIISRISRAFDEDDQSMGKQQTIFVCGEEHAIDVVRAYSAGSRSNNRRLIDLAETEHPPAFDEAIAVSHDSIRWKRLIIDAIDECFDNSCYHMAKIYADYFFCLINLDINSALQRIHDRSKIWPSAFSFGKIELSPRFKDCFQNTMKQTLEKGPIINSSGCRIDLKSDEIDLIVQKILPGDATSQGSML